MPHPVIVVHEPQAIIGKIIPASVEKPPRTSERWVRA